MKNTQKELFRRARNRMAPIFIEYWYKEQDGTLFPSLPARQDICISLMPYTSTEPISNIHILRPPSARGCKYDHYRRGMMWNRGSKKVVQYLELFSQLNVALLHMFSAIVWNQARTLTLGMLWKWGTMLILTSLNSFISERLRLCKMGICKCSSRLFGQVLKPWIWGAKMHIVDALRS